MMVADRRTMPLIRPLIVAMATTITLTGLAACGSEGGTSATDPAATSTSPQAQTYRTAFEVAEPTIHPDATAEFGEEAAAQGTQTVVDVVEKYGWDGDSMTVEPGVDLDEYVLSYLDYLAPLQHPNWKDITASAVADLQAGRTRTEAVRDLRGVTFYGALSGAAGSSAPADGPVVVDPAVTKVTSALYIDEQGESSLQVDIESQADLRGTDEAGDPTLQQVSRSQTFWVRPRGDTWVVWGWQGSLDEGPTVPDDLASP